MASSNVWNNLTPTGLMKNIFGGKNSSYDPMSAYTAEQKESVNALQSLASTGVGGGIDIATKYGGDLGYYNQADGEVQALNQLQGLYSGSDMTNARNTYQDLADTTFDPSDPKSGYAAFSRALAKSGAESQDALNQQAAMTGGVFGSGRGRDTASLQADLANQRGSYLANLYQNGRSQQLAGAQGLESLVGTQAGLSAQLQQQASIERQLKDQKAKDELTAYKTNYQQDMDRIGLMQGQLENPLGVIESTSQGYVGQLLGMFGSYLGGKASSSKTETTTK